MPKKWRRVPKEPDLGLAQAQFLPDQPHEPVAFRATGRITMTARRQHQTTLRRQNSSNLIRKGRYHQRMAHIDIVVMNRSVLRGAARFGKRLSEPLRSARD